MKLISDEIQDNESVSLREPISDLNCLLDYYLLIDDWIGFDSIRFESNSIFGWPTRLLIFAIWAEPHQILSIGNGLIGDWDQKYDQN